MAHHRLLSQHGLSNKDSLLSYIDSADMLLHSLGAVQVAVYPLAGMDAGVEVMHGLGWLGEQLTRELQQRTDALYQATRPTRHKLCRAKQRTRNKEN